MGRTRSEGFWRNALNRMTGGDDAMSAGEENPEAVPARKALHLAWQVGALLAITAGSIWLALNDEFVQRFSHWGYASSFLISLISNATVILPAPGLAVVLSLGASLNPILLGIVAGCGSGLGELSGYLAGATSSEMFRQRGVNTRLHRLTTRYTIPVLFVLAIVPTPLFDVAGILAGAIRLPIHRFLLPVISGKIIKHVLVAYLGAESIPLIRSMLGI